MHLQVKVMHYHTHFPDGKTESQRNHVIGLKVMQSKRKSQEVKLRSVQLKTQWSFHDIAILVFSWFLYDALLRARKLCHLVIYHLQVYVEANGEWEWLNQKWGPFGNFWSLGDNCGCLSCLRWSKPLGFWNKIPNYRSPGLSWMVRCGLSSRLQENHTPNHCFTLKDVNPEGLPLPCHGSLNPWLGTWPTLSLHVLSHAAFNLGRKFWG